MIKNIQGENFIYNNTVYSIGDRVIGTLESMYYGLYGTILEIRDGEDKETGNETPDIYCSFEKPVLPHRIRKLEKTFSDLYGETKKLNDIALDCVIMAPEMIHVITADEKLLTQKLYSVQEEWAENGECDSCVSAAYTSRESARLYMQNQLSDEMNDGIAADMRIDKRFVEESYDDSYECFIDDDYYENHYRIFITEQSIISSPAFLREMADIHNYSMLNQDYISAIEETEDITYSEYELLIAETDIPDLFRDALKHHEPFWDCYWGIFRSIIRSKLNYYRAEKEKGK